MPDENNKLKAETFELLDRVIYYFNNDKEQEALQPVDRDSMLFFMVEEYAKRHYPKAVDDVWDAHYNDPDRIESRRKLFNSIKKIYIKNGDESTLSENMKKEYYKLKEEFESE